MRLQSITLILRQNDKIGLMGKHHETLTPDSRGHPISGQDYGQFWDSQKSYTDKLSAKMFYIHRWILRQQTSWVLSDTKHWRARDEESRDVSATDAITQQLTLPAL